MNPRRFILPLILSVVIVLIQQVNAEGYELGHRGVDDIALEKNKLSARGVGKFPGPNGNLDEMKIFSGSGGRKITFLKVVDNGDNCAKAIPINGGPGSSFVVIHFTAPAGCRIDFDIELYGQRDGY